MEKSSCVLGALRIFILFCICCLAFTGCATLRQGIGDDDADDGIPAGLIDYIKSSNTDAGDLFGSSVALSEDGNTLAVGAPFEASSARGVKQPGDADYYSSQSDNSAIRTGAAYIFVRSGEDWVQQAYIKAINADADDVFGYDVCLSDDGNTLAVSASKEDGNNIGGQVDNSAPDSGAVYVYSRSVDTWYFEAYIKAANPEEGDWFGYSLALSGDGGTLAVGATSEDSGTGSPDDNSEIYSGAVYVFKEDASTWYQQAYLKAPEPSIDPYDEFGASVSLSDDGDILMVGVPGDDYGVDECGAVYLFGRTGFDWDFQYFLTPTFGIEGDNIGKVVALSSDGITAVAGGADESENVFVFDFSTTSGWLEQPLESVENEYMDKFGFNLALSEEATSLVISAPYESSSTRGIKYRLDTDFIPSMQDNSLSYSGAVFLFMRPPLEGRDFTQYAFIKAPNSDAFDYFGSAVALSRTGDTIAVGTPNEDSNAVGIDGNPDDNSALDSGAVYIYNF